MKVEDVIIIGAGPSGMAAAIQLRRQGFDPLVFEKGVVGGLLLNANRVENYPGFPDGISGPELAARFEKQFIGQSVRLIREAVIDLDFDGSFFHIEAATSKYQSRFAIIASGTKPLEIADIKIPEELRSRIYYEIFPILHEKGKRIVIVGAGDAAFDYALNLQRQNQVVILNRGAKSRCLPLLEERAGRADSISYFTDIKITKIVRHSDGNLRIDCIMPDGTVSFEADYLVFAIGRETEIGFLSERVKTGLHQLEEGGYLYRTGDVKNGLFRQTAIAVGDGIMAAMKINWILTEGQA